MRSTFLELVGLVAVAVGFGLVWFPLGVIAGGVAVFVVGLYSEGD